MNTYFEFLTHIKGVEYIISVVTIAGFILFLEILKPTPFRSLLRNTQEDLDYLRKSGYRDTARTIGRIVCAPFVGLAYVIILPFVFTYAVGSELFRMAVEGWERAIGLAGKTAFFGWRPMEAYFGGKKEKKDAKREDAEPQEKQEEKE